MLDNVYQRHQGKRLDYDMGYKENLLVVYENMLCSNSITFTEVDVILRTNIYRLRGKKVYNLEVSLGLQS